MNGSLEVIGAVAMDPRPAGIPIATESVPAGWPSPAADYFDGDIDLNTHLIRNRPATFLVRVDGDSELTVKRLHLTDTGPELCPENPAYRTIRPAGELMVWGVVTTCLHHLHR